MTPKQLWLDALRSGEFTQTDGVLKDDKGYCCLGVAEALYAKTHETPPVYTRGPNVVYLLEKTRTWLGINRDQMITLSRLNDSGMNFNDIADYIECNL